MHEDWCEEAGLDLISSQPINSPSAYSQLGPVGEKAPFVGLKDQWHTGHHPTPPSIIHKQSIKHSLCGSLNPIFVHLLPLRIEKKYRGQISWRFLSDDSIDRFKSSSERILWCCDYDPPSGLGHSQMGLKTSPGISCVTPRTQAPG